MNREHVCISRRAGGSGFMPSWFILLLTIILLAGTAANSYGLSFGPAANYAAGTTPYAVAVSDFDGDGRTDLAAANYGSNTVSVLLGNGDGTFQAAVNFAAGTNPTSVAAADFDGNGAPDLAVTNEGDRKISILLGNGNGTFQPAATYTVGNEPSSVVISDLNKDGRLDLVIANYRSNNVSVLLGNGNGTFQARINYTIGGTRPYSVTTGDFNSDGNIDLAVANGTSSNISVLLGSGGGTFAAAVLYPTGTAPRAVASGDFNGDGNADLASANSGSNSVSVLLGYGDGTFQAAVAYAAGTSPLSVTTGDMNGDGKPDLAVANSGSSDVSVLLGNGDGTFQAAVAYASGTSPRSVAAGYFNSDGKQDLATANSGGNTVSVLLNTSAPETTITSSPSGTVNVSTADFTFISEAGATFECDLDGAGYAVCASPAGYTGLTDVLHTFMVRAKDSAGTTDPTPASQSWTIDTTAPDTTITAGPSGTVSGTTASFTFTSEVGAMFECQLDAGGFSACTSPKDYLALTDGPHTFMVRAKDALGNTDATPASQSWTVDTTAPETAILSGPSGTVNVAIASFTFSANETATFECELDGAGYVACASPADYAGLADGPHTFMARATDAMGYTDLTPASQSWTIDATAPDTTITAGPSGTVSATTASFTFTSEVGATFECQIDGGGYAACTSPKDYLALTDGPHTFMVRAKDALGNTDATPASQSWTVDTTAPDTAITAGPSGTVNATTASFTFSSEVGATFECQLDGTGFSACASPKDYTGLADGIHTFMVRAKDALGNTDLTPASQSWTVDATAPDTTITGGPSGTVNVTAASFTFTSEVGATFECDLDGNGYSVCTSPKDYLALADGPHTFMVRAKDALGNTDASPASQSWTIFIVRHTLSITKVGPGIVSSTPSGITCGGDCSEAYPENTSVTLSATPDAGNVFEGWSGACSGRDACIVTMTAAKAVTANFASETAVTWTDESGVQAACVSSANALINALVDAETDGQPNRIKVVQGTYRGLFAYAGENQNLELLGGYSAACASRTINPALTILDGDIDTSGTADGVVLDLMVASAGAGNITVDGFTVRNGENIVDEGGCVRIFTDSGQITVAGNVVTGCGAVDAGGIGAGSGGGKVLIVNNIVYGNAAVSAGGIGASTMSGQIVILNNTVTDNLADDPGQGGGGAGLGVTLYGNSATLDIANNIIWGNSLTAGTNCEDVVIDSDGEQDSEHAIVQFRYNDITGTNSACSTDLEFSLGTGNITADPLFVNTGAGNYHIQPTSICRNIGLNGHPDQSTIDIDGNVRVQESLIEIGADEVALGPPGAPLMLSPLAVEVNTATPTYTWNAVAGADYYRIYAYTVGDPNNPKINAWYSALQAGCDSGSGICSYTPGVALSNIKAYEWYTMAKNAAGQGPWSNKGSFSVVTEVVQPATAPVTISPAGSQYTSTPTYSWNALPGIKQYRLWVAINDDPNNPKVNAWYTAEQAGCAGGVGVCSIRPDVPLADARYNWFVRGRNTLGEGPWSSTNVDFSVVVTSIIPGAATLVSPMGTIGMNQPAYTWNAVSGTTHYRIYMADQTNPNMPLVNAWYTAEQVGCSSGTGTCSYTPNVTLPDAAYYWWIRTKSVAGQGPWSGYGAFTVITTTTIPVAPTLVTPNGTITNATPAFTWNAVSNATSYRIYLTDAANNVELNKWYTKEQAGCASGTGTCSITPALSLTNDSYKWKMQGKNIAGTSIWSANMFFTKQ